jgi:hypothetical protein
MNEAGLWAAMMAHALIDVMLLLELKKNASQTVL